MMPKQGWNSSTSLKEQRSSGRRSRNGRAASGRKRGTSPSSSQSTKARAVGRTSRSRRGLGKAEAKHPDDGGSLNLSELASAVMPHQDDELRSALALARARENLAKASAKEAEKRILRLERDCESLENLRRAKKGLEASVGNAIHALEESCDIAHLALTGRRTGRKKTRESGNLSTLSTELQAMLTEIAARRMKSAPKQKAQVPQQTKSSVGTQVNPPPSKGKKLLRKKRTQSSQTSLSAENIVEMKRKLRERSAMLATLAEKLRDCGRQMDSRRVSSATVKSLLSLPNDDAAYNPSALPDMVEVYQFCEAMQEIVALALDNGSMAVEKEGGENSDAGDGIASESAASPSEAEEMKSPSMLLQLEFEAMKMKASNRQDEIERLQQENEELKRELVEKDKLLNDIYTEFEEADEMEERAHNALAEEEGGIGARNAEGRDGGAGKDETGNASPGNNFQGLDTLAEEMRLMRAACEEELRALSSDGDGNAVSLDRAFLESERRTLLGNLNQPAGQ
eukprot:g5378.t1